MARTYWAKVAPGVEEASICGCRVQVFKEWDGRGWLVNLMKPGMSFKAVGRHLPSRAAAIAAAKAAAESEVR